MQLDIKRSPSSDISRPYNHAQLHHLLYDMLPASLRQQAHGSRMGFFSTSGMGYTTDQIYHAGQPYTLTVSSPHIDLIYARYESIAHTSGYTFGDTTIEFLRATHKNDPMIHGSKILRSKTPLVISIPSHLYQKNNISDDHTPHYRVKKDGFGLRTHQLHKNILSKYLFLFQQGRRVPKDDRDTHLLEIYNHTDRSLYDTFCQSQNFFSGYKYKRNAVATYKSGYIGGSLWDLVVASDIYSIRVIQAVLPLGFGERCTAGFGWMR